MIQRPPLVALVLASVLAGCSSPEVEPAAPPPPGTLGRWTEAFEQPGLLLADEIEIEGPPALRAHIALPQDDERYSVEVKATNRGLLQVVTTRGSTEVQAQLDNWTLAALRRLTVLERPGETDVRIVARGDAYSRMNGVEERGAELTFQGALFE